MTQVLPAPCPRQTISSPPLLRTHIFVKFLCQLLDVPQDFLLVPLFCTHALHFISNELEGREVGERSSSPLGRIPSPSPCPSSVPRSCQAGLSTTAKHRGRSPAYAVGWSTSHPFPAVPSAGGTVRGAGRDPGSCSPHRTGRWHGTGHPSRSRSPRTPCPPAPW